MSFQENGLDISVFPPGGEKIAPINTDKTRVAITNKRHKKGIRLEVSLDLPLELQKWCNNLNHKITIGYQQTQEINFLWNIPPQAIPDTYNYNLRIEFLRSTSTSFSAFQPKRRQLTILQPKVKAQKNIVEPSFIITPASSSTKPITLSSRDTLNLEINVHNRSNRTDNYRISTDLETAWYTINYPETIKRLGAIDGNEALNLNPNKEGNIHLTINPSADTVAGNYRPEIKLYSLNYPDIFLKKILYLNIPPQYLLQAELKTILNKVSYKSGQYQIILTNQGNTFRAIELRAYSSDEDEFCEYYLEPSSARIPPNKTLEVKLEVKPNAKQKRPLFATKQFNFQVDLIDKNDYPLPQTLPLKNNLFWRSRPLWQSILLLLLLLGCIGGAAWFIWKKINRPKLQPEVSLTAEKKQYYYGGEPIIIEWTLKNPSTIDKIIIFDLERPQDKINTKCYYFNSELNHQNCTLINEDNPLNTCPSKTNTICHQDTFIYAKNVKDYIFELQALNPNNEIIQKQTTQTKILPRETFSILEPITISPNKPTYRPNNNIELNFEVSNFNILKEQDKISLLINNEVTTIIDSQNKEQYCSLIEKRDRYNCNIKISQLKEGENTLKIKTEYDPDGLIETKSQSISLPKQIIVQTPIIFDYFTINGRSNTQIEVEPNTRITVRWSVTGKEVKANISCIPQNIRSSGSKSIEILPGKSSSCTLTAFDIHGQKITPKNITVFVKELPKPKPPPPQIIIQPNLNNFR